MSLLVYRHKATGLERVVVVAAVVVVVAVSVHWPSGICHFNIGITIARSIAVLCPTATAVDPKPPKPLNPKPLNP